MLVAKRIEDVTHLRCVFVQFKLLAPVTIKCWVMLVLVRPDELDHGGPGSLQRFGDTLVQTFTGMGIAMPPVRR